MSCQIAQYSMVVVDELNDEVILSPPNELINIEEFKGLTYWGNCRPLVSSFYPLYIRSLMRIDDWFKCVQFFFGQKKINSEDFSLAKGNGKSTMRDQGNGWTRFSERFEIHSAAFKAIFAHVVLRWAMKTIQQTRWHCLMQSS